MASMYTREQLKLSIAKMCLTIGWHTTMTTPIELLTDILCNYLCQLSKLTNDYATGFGLNEACIDHLLLAFKDFHVNLRDLGEFVKNVDCPEPPLSVPLYPIPREDHLNFLKPGSKEVVTRQVHVHEHLPPMFPHLEEESVVESTSSTDEKAAITVNTDTVFKRPAEISQDVFKRPRILSDLESGRPTREISSVIMTSSGFLSPSREGRLPEARTPAIALEPSVLPVSPEQSESVKKVVKGLKKSEKVKDYTGQKLFKPYEDIPFHKDTPFYKDAAPYKDTLPYKDTPSYKVISPYKITSPYKDKDVALHKDTSHKSMSLHKDISPYKDTSTYKDVPSHKDTPFYKDPPPYKDSFYHKDTSSKKDSHSNKHNNIKGMVRNKVKHHSHTNGIPTLPMKNYMVVKESKSDPSLKKPAGENDTHLKFNKTLAAARMKTEKFNTTITPIPPRSIPATIVRPEQLVDKLFTEPDKKKLNILKRISVKADKGDKGEKSYKVKEELKLELKASTSQPIVDEPGVNVASHNLPKDITIELINPSTTATISSKRKFEKVDKYSFDDYSPPGTPSTPRTPEMVSDSSIAHKGGKHKSKSKHRKIHKHSSPSAIDTDVVDTAMERPKTPDTSVTVKSEKRAQLPIPPMNFPFFAPFSGPGLIPSPLTNPLFPHLPMSSLGLSSFGQPPYIPSMPMNFMGKPRSPILPSSTVTSPKSIAAAANTSNTRSPTPASYSFTSPSSSPIVSSTVVKDDEYNIQPTTSTNLDKILPPFTRHDDDNMPSSSGVERKSKEHKKDKPKKKNKKDKDKHKSEKRKLKAEKKERSRTKKEKKERKKQKEAAKTEEESQCLPKLTLKLPPKKINIKAVVKPMAAIEPQPSTSKSPDYASPRETSPEIARFSALVTGQPKARSAVTSTSPSIDTFPTSSTDIINTKKPITPTVRTSDIPEAPTLVDEPSASSYIDSEGKTVWICPGCGIQDDGSPMIGCDDCDAWYHWVCVGIQVPPDDNEDWYCRHCIHRNRDLLKREKRKKRKAKERRTRRRH